MEWTRIPTSLLVDRVPGRDIVAIVKYQLLWAIQEKEPTESLALKYMSKKELEIVSAYRDSIAQMVDGDINAMNRKRRRQRAAYAKNKRIANISTDGPTEHIRDEKTGKENMTSHNTISEPVFLGIPLPTILPN